MRGRRRGLKFASRAEEDTSSPCRSRQTPRYPPSGDARDTASNIASASMKTPTGNRPRESPHARTTSCSWNDAAPPILKSSSTRRWRASSCSADRLTVACPSATEPTVSDSSHNCRPRRRNRQASSDLMFRADYLGACDVSSPRAPRLIIDVQVAVYGLGWPVPELRAGEPRSSVTRSRNGAPTGPRKCRLTGTSLCSQFPSLCPQVFIHMFARYGPRQYRWR